jgi:hypothetical protein
MNGKQQHHQEENQRQKPIRHQEERQHHQSPGALGAMAQLQPGLTGIPLGRGTRPQRQAHLLQLQRQHGNSAVMRLLQREEGGTGAAAPAAPIAEPAAEPSAAAPTEINAGGNLVRVTDSGVEITGASVSINAASLNANTAFSRFSGVLQTDTMIANSVVGNSYTPGAGNIW